MYKNIDQSKILSLANEVSYQDGQVVSKTLVQNDKVSITLFSFDANEEISTHTTNGDALVTVLGGEGTIHIGDETFVMKEGDSIVMPKGIPHSLFASKKFKMMLVVSY